MLRHIEEFTIAIDKMLKMGNKLPENFKVKEAIKELAEDEVCSFDYFYDTLANWAIT